MSTKTTNRLRQILAANVYARLLARYQGKSDNERLLKLKEETGLGKRTLQRILKPGADDHDVTLGTVEEIAKALRCEAYELLQEPEE